MAAGNIQTWELNPSSRHHCFLNWSRYAPASLGSSSATKLSLPLSKYRCQAAWPTQEV